MVLSRSIGARGVEIGPLLRLPALAKVLIQLIGFESILHRGGLTDTLPLY